MTIKIGINGMGRIGRMVLRAIIESKNKNIIIKHINNRTNVEITSNLLKYDSIKLQFLFEDAIVTLYISFAHNIFQFPLKCFI